MKVIGITGGVGSGKSLISKILMEQYGAHIINTDQIAKDQMRIGGASYHDVVNYFGKEIQSEDGTIDRSKLANIVFQDKDKLLKLNELTHPPVLEAVKEEILCSRAKETVPYLLIETALMIEAGFDYICDEVWYVHTPEEERRNRLKRDRGYTEEQINQIFRSQSKAEDFLARFPKVIENTGDIKGLQHQVSRLLSQLLSE